MTMTTLAVQAPRILGVILAAFFALFAFDSVGTGLPIAEASLAVAMNLLPAAIVLVLVVVGCWWPLAGASGFFAVAALYAYWVDAAATPQGRADWIAAIAGPLLLVGAGFLWTGLRQRRLRLAAPAR